MESQFIVVTLMILGSGFENTISWNKMWQSTHSIFLLRSGEETNLLCISFSRKHTLKAQS